MKIFIATSFSGKVDYGTGQVKTEFKNWLKFNVLDPLKNAELNYFCAIEMEGWKVNNSDSTSAIIDDFNNLRESDLLLVILDKDISPGLQIEIGIAYERKMPIILAHEKDVKLKWSNQALIDAKFAKELILPITEDKLKDFIS
jgi:hypothetical protein